MLRRWLRPAPFFGLATVLLLGLILAAFEDRRPTCGPTAGWFDGLVYIVGSLSAIAVYGGVVAYIRRRGWSAVAAGLAGFAVAAIWVTGGAFVLLLVLVVPDGCLN